MDLTRLFTGVAWKRLVAVEAEPGRSNQHELNGATPLRALLGAPVGRMRFPVTYLYVPDDSDDLRQAEGFVTWYDARAAHETRSELRLYYQGNEVTEWMKEDDLLVLARTSDRLLFLVAPAGSTSEQQLIWLFELEGAGADAGSIRVKPIAPDDERPTLVVNSALSAVGIELPIPQTDHLAWSGVDVDRIAEVGFPRTRDFSQLCRSTISDFDEMATADPDAAIVAAMEREEAIFRAIEKAMVERQLDRGFRSVDDFVSFSLSVHNRRKSRAGHAFEHHLASILRLNEVQFEQGVQTENKSKPDFIFPSGDAYHDLQQDTAELDMLGAKTSCKDRWRQVLTEAARITRKHLVTLEPAISEDQTDEMEANLLQLVVPTAVAPSFSKRQRRWLMTVGEFIGKRQVEESRGGGGF